ncbi:pyrimidine dimer DNA glycosylase/endonuclease V [Desulfovibrio litoralis]|uniref:Pyrimidine dimer DNA glycosylase /DNA-(Apurinic or apyrimidinic site) lyase n=1 Tax=Desulfovibrio litoralis DSM 11393 TaxID=1121455 RepID=A0A1M7SRQ7_9BACT|nr:pyrimidine dimer DNA glycosylase/endonuclease V [Desulfovibrio litoralis]SHN61159.1 Pyrimidine dimer DNA glycosylase /DNA-(apurinic or apyrimidinic site) lyase [Desulfovibrio litoralis DSM 11393]
MTRMWGVNPKKMCRKHLLGEHVEMHMLASSIDTGRSVKGFQDNNCLDAPLIEERHNQLADEMLRRGYKHNSPLYHQNNLASTPIDVDASYKELIARCRECYKLSLEG